MKPQKVNCDIARDHCIHVVGLCIPLSVCDSVHMYTVVSTQNERAHVYTIVSMQCDRVHIYTVVSTQLDGKCVCTVVSIW